MICAVGASRAEVAGHCPFNALRFGFGFTAPGKWPAMRAAIEKNRAAFDEVWFSTGISYPPLEWHRLHSGRCAAAVADLRRLGVVPSIEIQTIIGHGDDLLASGDCSGQTWGTWTGCDGTAAKHAACSRDPRLAAYFVRVAEIYAEWRPGSMWIDDDVTLRNRAPMNPARALDGCFCDRCVSAFSAAEGKRWTRAELEKALRSDKQVAGRWWDFQAGSLAELAGGIVRAAHAVSPETRFGYQFGGTWAKQIVEAIHAAGGSPVRLRPGAGAYWDTNPFDQLEKAYYLQVLVRKYGEIGCAGEVCPEIETCPRTFSCRTPQGVILEAFENLALGMDFLSMFIADTRGGEDVAYYADRLFPRLAEANGFLKAYRDASEGASPCGFTVPGGIPPPLVACRGIPVAAGKCISLGELPDVGSIPVRTAGSGWVKGKGLHTRIMQIAAGPALISFAEKCDEASGGRTPVMFGGPVMAWVMPRVAPDGALKTVAVVNASIDRQEPVAVKLRGAGGARIFWRTPEGSRELRVAGCASAVEVELPRIGAWQCGFIEVRH
ncbi:MAG: hypothetical protein J6T01_02430 [Kiritimatiellae bacterium]|nr:hypothetical protein [Kiritimatiellia bacterium]